MMDPFSGVTGVPCAIHTPKEHMKNNVPFLFFESSAGRSPPGKRTALVNSPEYQRTQSVSPALQIRCLGDFGRLSPILRQKSARDQCQAEERRPFEGIATDGSGRSAEGVVHQKRRQHGDACGGPREHRDLLCVSFHTANMLPPPSAASPESRFPKLFSAPRHPTAGLNRERN